MRGDRVKNQDNDTGKLGNQLSLYTRLTSVLYYKTRGFLTDQRLIIKEGTLYSNN